MRLRDVQLTDVAAYVRMRCDPVMTAELGGPLPRAGIEEKVQRDVEQAAAGISLIKMIVPDAARPGKVAGSVTLWSHEQDGTAISEIGWMVLPEYQGRGIAKQAVRALLWLAAAEERWGVVHAFPALTNGPSNGLCRSLGFWLDGEKDITFAGCVFRTNHWVIDPGTGLG